jgi:hypothetical protein
LRAVVVQRCFSRAGRRNVVAGDRFPAGAPPTIPDPLRAGSTRPASHFFVIVKTDLPFGFLGKNRLQGIA